MDCIIDNLQCEEEIISKLLIRNKNQHGKMKPYQFLRKAVNLLHMIPLKNLKTLGTLIDSDVKKTGPQQK